MMPCNGMCQTEKGSTMSLIDSESVQLEETGTTAFLTVNRPKHMNALNIDVLQGMMLALGKLKSREDLRAVVVRGSGEKAFVAGADIHGMAELGPRAIAEYVELGQRVMRELECLEIPTIAEVGGYALGGGLELALACDLIFASEGSKLGQPEVNLGIIPGFGGTQRLLARCGLGTTRRLVFSGEIISAEEALSLGIVDKVFAGSELSRSVKEYAELIASKGPLAVRGAKEVIRQASEQVLLSGLRLEVEKFLELFQTADREEGMNAFMQKREPKFSGK